MDQPRDKLPRRDFILIPMLVLVTLSLLAVLGEASSRVVFAESDAETCAMVGPGGVTVIRPNCQSHRKAAEGPDTINAYNDCGYRTPAPCHDRAASSIRVAVMGASAAEGLKVRYNDTFAGRLSVALSSACGRPVEFQNMGVAGATLLDIYRRTEEALAMRPDVVLLVLTPYEMKEPIGAAAMALRDAPPRPGGDLPSQTPAPVRSLVSLISDLAYNSRMLVAAQHFLFQDRSTFVRLFMLHGEDADYLRAPLSAAWQHRLADFETLLTSMADRAHAAGLPMLLALSPQRVQASLTDGSVRPVNVDPFQVGRALGAIAARHGVGFVDSLEGFARERDPDEMYYAVDGHMDAEGHAVFAASVLDGLTRQTAVFRKCSEARIATRAQ